MVSYDVWLKEQQSNQWCVSLNHGQSWSCPPDYPALSVPYDDSGSFTYTIKSGSTFATDPLAIEMGNHKPQKGHISGLITVTQKTPTVLQFSDSNNVHKKNDLDYVLYFQDGSTLDPIISNGGCCSKSESSRDYLWYGIGAVAAIVIIWLVIRMIKRPDTSRPRGS